MFPPNPDQTYEQSLQEIEAARWALANDALLRGAVVLIDNAYRATQCDPDPAVLAAMVLRAFRRMPGLTTTRAAGTLEIVYWNDAPTGLASWAMFRDWTLCAFKEIANFDGFYGTAAKAGEHTISIRAADLDDAKKRLVEWTENRQ